MSIVRYDFLYISLTFFILLFFYVYMLLYSTIKPRDTYIQQKSHHQLKLFINLPDQAALPTNVALVPIVAV